MPKKSAKKAPGRKQAKPARTKQAAKPTARKPTAKTPARKTLSKRASVTRKAPVKKKAPAKKKAPVKKLPAKKKAVAKKTAEAKPKAEKKALPKKPSLLERKVPPRKPGSVICPLSGFEVMPTTPNLSEKTIERLRRKLAEERDRHVRQAEELQAEAEALALERDPGDTQFDEESGEGDTVNVERERDLLLSASARQIVDAIDRALARMDDKTYGLCVPAGRRIALERLEAIPYAEECVDCKARAERRR
jgi:RNA polymerase-binding transcription factor DksA